MVLDARNPVVVELSVWRRSESMMLARKHSGTVSTATLTSVN